MIHFIPRVQFCVEVFPYLNIFADLSAIHHICFDTSWRHVATIEKSLITSPPSNNCNVKSKRILGQYYLPEKVLHIWVIVWVLSILLPFLHRIPPLSLPTAFSRTGQRTWITKVLFVKFFLLQTDRTVGPIFTVFLSSGKHALQF